MYYVVKLGGYPLLYSGNKLKKMRERKNGAVHYIYIYIHIHITYYAVVRARVDRVRLPILLVVS